MDSPRGRIYLVNQILDGAELTATAAEHFDRCLGCMACMTACPSGVQYDQLIEATRQQIERRHDRPPADRLFRNFIFWLFPHPERLRLLVPFMLLYQRSGLRSLATRSGLVEKLPPRLAALHAMMPTISRRKL